MAAETFIELGALRQLVRDYHLSHQDTTVNGCRCDLCAAAEDWLPDLQPADDRSQESQHGDR